MKINLPKILMIVIWVIIALTMFLHISFMYNLIVNNTDDLNQRSLIISSLTALIVFLYSIKCIAYIIPKIKKSKEAFKLGVSEKMDGFIYVASLRIKHGYIYLFSHVSLLIFSICLYLLFKEFGENTNAEFSEIASSPIFLIALLTLVFYLITRFIFAYKDSKLNNDLFLAEMKHYKELWEKEN